MFSYPSFMILKTHFEVISKGTTGNMISFLSKSSLGNADSPICMVENINIKKKILNI